MKEVLDYLAMVIFSVVLLSLAGIVLFGLYEAPILIPFFGGVVLFYWSIDRIEKASKEKSG